MYIYVYVCAFEYKYISTLLIRAGCSTPDSKEPYNISIGKQAKCSVFNFYV